MSSLFFNSKSLDYQSQIQASPEEGPTELADREPIFKTQEKERVSVCASVCVSMHSGSTEAAGISLAD